MHHPEIPTRRLTSLIVIPYATGIPADITDQVVEVVEHQPHPELGSVVTARYIKEPT